MPTVVLPTALPGIWLAARLVDNEVSGSRARDFVRKEFGAASVHGIETRVAPGTHDIEITLTRLILVARKGKPARRPARPTGD